MACPKNAGVYFETAHNIETNKETLRKPGTEVKWPILKPSPKRLRFVLPSTAALERIGLAGRARARRISA